ncbi:hypothetical protein E2C01_015433 [Portunus trituberculatus]|uniref:Uncharacterized protein n=1 Tax=Portunus trituberculatus TaxID=210409 RepID=A0A5B7DLN1_PORTR|nr:hypothetical protein [Portunus trituberculatus]
MDEHSNNRSSSSGNKINNKGKQNKVRHLTSNKAEDNKMGGQKHHLQCERTGHDSNLRLAVENSPGGRNAFAGHTSCPARLDWTRERQKREKREEIVKGKGLFVHVCDY